MKKDNEDLKNLWLELSSQVKILESERKKFDLNPAICLLSVTIPGTLIGILLATGAVLEIIEGQGIQGIDPLVLFSFPLLSAGGYGSLISLSVIKNFACIYKNLRTCKKNLAYVQFLIEKTKIEKIKDTDRE